MISTLIGIIIAVAVVGFLWWAIQQLIPLLPVAEPFTTIIRILLAAVVFFVVLWIIIQLLALGGVHVNTFKF